LEFYEAPPPPTYSTEAAAALLNVIPSWRGKWEGEGKSLSPPIPEHFPEFKRELCSMNWGREIFSC